LAPPDQIIVGVRVLIVPLGDDGVGGISSPIADADWHGEAAAPLVLSVNTSAGDNPAGGLAGAAAKLRLFVSAVVPSSTQEGAPELAVSTAVLTTIVAPLLKFASVPQQSPTTLNSATFQPCARFRTVSSPNAA
jgi:hypothetical protein